MRNPARHGFFEYCDMMRNMEKDKDHFIKAARLEHKVTYTPEQPTRYESRNPSSVTYALTLFLIAFEKFCGKERPEEEMQILTTMSDTLCKLVDAVAVLENRRW